MGKDQIDNDFFDDADDDIVEVEKKEEIGSHPVDEKESENNEDKFFASDPDEKSGNEELDAFFDDSYESKPLLSDEFEDSEEDIEKVARKKKAKKRAVVISAFSVFVVAVCVFAFVFVNQYMNRFIMTVDGKKISVEEYKLFYYTTSSDTEDIKNYALESLKQLITVENLAKAKNISLTEEEKSNAVANVQYFKEYFASLGYDMPAISDDRLAEIMGASETLYTKLYDAMVADYIVDDSDFDEQYEDYLTNYKAYYIKADYQYLMIQTEEDAQKAKDAINAGEDIVKVMKTYAIGYETEDETTEETEIAEETEVAEDEESDDATENDDTAEEDEASEDDEVPTLGIYEISYYFSAEDVEHLLALSEGQVSNVMEFTDYGCYMIFINQSMYIPTEEEKVAEFSDMYYENKKYYMFTEEFEAFQNEAKIKVNEKLLDTFT